MLIQRLRNMYKLMQFPLLTIHVRSSQEFHQHFLSCNLHVCTSTAKMPVRNFSALSRNVSQECWFSRKNAQILKTLKSLKIRSEMMKRNDRFVHDDTLDKDKNCIENEDAYSESVSVDELVDEEDRNKLILDPSEDIGSNQIQNMSETPNLLTNETNMTKKHDDVFDIGENCIENEDVNAENVLEDKLVDREDIRKLILDLSEETGSSQIQKRPKTPNLLTSERSMTENSLISLSSETDFEESVKDKESDQNGTAEPRHAPGSQSSGMDIEKFMTDVGMVYDTGHTGYYTLCPKFGKLAMKKKNKKKEERLYINSTSGYFHCRHCGTSGTWSQLKDNIEYIRSKKSKRRIECFQNIPDVEKETDDIPPQVNRQLEGALDFSTMTDETFDTVLSIFEWHGIEKKTFIDHGIKYKANGNEYIVIFPTHVPTTGHLASVSVYTGKITEDGDIRTDPVQSYPRGKVAHLFGWLELAKLKRATQNILVITISEADAMAVSQATGILTLSLKNISQLPQEALPYLEEFSKIILWLGTDVKAWDNTKLFAKKLGDKRCYVFRPTVLKYMPLEVLQIGHRIQDILNLPKLMNHNSIVTFGDVRHEVYSEFAHVKQVAGVQWKRYKKMNTLLKGHRRGELTILTGPTGSGKTTFMSEYSLDLCMQGVNTLWGSFEISNVRLVKMMMQQFAGKSISKHLNEFDEIADEFSSLPIYFMMYYGQEKVKNVLEAMSHAVYIHDIGHVVVDNLQFMMGMDFTEKNRFFRQDQIVSEFRNFATEKNCHVTLIIHPRKVNEGEELSTASVFGSAKVTQEADNILLVQDQKTSRSSRKYIQVAKNRFDGDLGVMTLSFNKESLTFTTIDKRKMLKTEEESEEKEEPEVVS